MKAVKGFVKTCYSESLVIGSLTPENDLEDGSISTKGDGMSDVADIPFHCGLGVRFKFPGDPKKLVQSCPVNPPSDSAP